jgi:hypothetical protein
VSDLSKNQLFSRRGFVLRAAQHTTVAGVGAGLLALRADAQAQKKTNPWAYDDSLYRKTDPSLIRYREVGRFQTTQPSPRCFCLTKDGTVLVGAGQQITEYSETGDQLSEFSVEFEIRCLALAPEHGLYLGFRDHIEVYDRKGQRRATWETPGKRAYFTAIAATENDVFVADAGSRIVWRYDPAGKIKGRIGEKSTERRIPGFIVPSPFFDVQVAPDGLLRVTNTGRHQVEVYTPDGDLELSWGKPGAAIENFCGCCNPIATVPLRDGRIVTLEKGIPRVKVYSARGVFESVVAGAESFPENERVCGPNDCTLGGLDGAVDAKGRIYVLDLVAGSVRIMEEKPKEA